MDESRLRLSCGITFHMIPESQRMEYPYRGKTLDMGSHSLIGEISPRHVRHIEGRQERQDTKKPTFTE